MSKPCSWFRCEDDGEIDLIGLVSSTNPLVHASPLDMPPLGEVCSKHYLELRDTLALYRAGNMARQTGRALFADPDPLTPPKMALVAVPNECTCGHASSSHYFASYDHPRGCYACDNEGTKCAAWMPGTQCSDPKRHAPHPFMANDGGAGVAAHCPGREYDA